MNLATKEQLQEIRESVDELLVWEYIRLKLEIKIALLDTQVVNANNLDQIFEEYINFEHTSLRDESDQNRGTTYEK